MSNYPERAAFYLACDDNPIIINETLLQIKNRSCSYSSPGFSFYKCNASYSAFLSIVDTMIKSFLNCIPYFISQLSPPEESNHIAHIDIFKSEAMGVRGVTYLVDSMCNFVCNFKKAAANVNLEKSFSFLITFVNNSISRNSSILNDCPAGEIYYETLAYNTKFDILLINSAKILNSTCISLTITLAIIIYPHITKGLQSGS